MSSICLLTFIIFKVNVINGILKKVLEFSNIHFSKRVCYNFDQMRFLGVFIISLITKKRLKN